jgi:hypothetical protein
MRTVHATNRISLNFVHRSWSEASPRSNRQAVISIVPPERVVLVAVSDGSEAARRKARAWERHDNMSP